MIFKFLFKPTWPVDVLQSCPISESLGGGGLRGVKLIGPPLLLGFFAWRALSLHACVTSPSPAAHPTFDLVHIPVFPIYVLPEMIPIFRSSTEYVAQIVRVYAVCVGVWFLLSRDSFLSLCIDIAALEAPFAAANPQSARGYGVNMSHGNICHWWKEKTILFLIVLE